jgi:hypothetical protein
MRMKDYVLSRQHLAEIAGPGVTEKGASRFLSLGRKGKMGRRFAATHGGRMLNICVRPVDEAWELWVCEGGKRLLLGATVPIDSAIEQWRTGLDPIARSAENIRRGIEQEALAVPASAEAKCPANCLDNSPPCAGRNSISDSLRR